MVLEPEPKTFGGWSRSPKFGFRLRSPALNDMKSTACEMLARCKFTSQYAENTIIIYDYYYYLWLSCHKRNTHHPKKTKETITQMGNEQYDSHTNPFTVYVGISYQHQLSAT